MHWLRVFQTVRTPCSLLVIPRAAGALPVEADRVALALRFVHAGGSWPRLRGHEEHNNQVAAAIRRRRDLCMVVAPESIVAMSETGSIASTLTPGKRQRP